MLTFHFTLALDARKEETRNKNKICTGALTSNRYPKNQNIFPSYESLNKEY
jgi:hypothetical protein